MNPGPVEEAGKAAGTFMQIMKDQPLALALVVCNLVLLGLFFFVAHTASDNRRHEFEQILESQKEVNKLLYSCVPGPRTELQADVPLPPLRPIPRE